MVLRFFATLRMTEHSHLEARLKDLNFLMALKGTSKTKGAHKEYFMKRLRDIKIVFVKSKLKRKK